MAVKKDGVPHGGKLVDFDMARHVDSKTGRPLSNTPSADGRTGTIPFMAADLCRRPPHNHFPRWHLPRYDLESFIWVFVWILVRPRVQLPSQTPAEVVAKQYPTQNLPFTILRQSDHAEHPTPKTKSNTTRLPSQPIIPGSLATPSTPIQPAVKSSKSVKHKMPETGKSKDEKWWNNRDLEVVAILKHAVAESPNTQVLDPHSTELFPLMVQLLQLLDQSYKLVKARDQEIHRTTMGRDRGEDLAWYEWPGNILTEDSLLSIFETFWKNMPDT